MANIIFIKVQEENFEKVLYYIVEKINEKYIKTFTIIKNRTEEIATFKEFEQAASYFKKEVSLKL